MEIRLSLGDIIKEERREQKMTQIELATKANISRSSIQLYEKGQLKPNIKTLEQIAAAFGYSIARLLDKYNLYDEYIPPNFNGDAEAYEQFKQACDNDAQTEQTDDSSNNNIKLIVKPWVGLRSDGTLVIPVLKKVFSGSSREMEEYLTGAINLSPAQQEKYGECFGLMLSDDSMMPKFIKDDFVIVQKNFVLSNGDIVIISINGKEAICRQVFKQDNGIMVQAFDALIYPAHFFTNEQIKSLPVVILGKVVEMRRFVSHTHEEIKKGM